MFSNKSQLPTEEFIKSHWKTPSSKPTASIICITYNHKKYISQCLNSLLSQKTKYSFEIVIHDDNSTDGTKEIIKAYEERFPSIINTIIQTENQYSKGVRILPTLVIPFCRGDFYAICEADDFWSYEYKLEKQIDVMITHPDIILSCHGANIVDAANESTIATHYPTKSNGFISNPKAILGDGGLIPTQSIVVRSIVGQNIPTWWSTAHISDYPLVLTATLHGKIYSFHELWSSYRTNVINSWSSRTPTNFNVLLNHAVKMDKILSGYIKECDHNNIQIVRIRISEYYFNAFYRTNGQWKEKRLEFFKHENRFTIIDKAIVGLRLFIKIRSAWIKRKNIP